MCPAGGAGSEVMSREAVGQRETEQLPVVEKFSSIGRNSLDVFSPTREGQTLPSVPPHICVSVFVSSGTNDDLYVKVHFCPNDDDTFCPCAPLYRLSAPGTSWRHTVWKNTRYNRKLCCTLTGEVLTDGPASGLTLMLCFHRYQFGDAVQRRGRSAGHGSG